MHPYRHGTTHSVRAIYNHLPGAALTPPRCRNLPSWRIHTTNFILWIEGKQNLSQQELEKDHSVLRAQNTTQSHQLHGQNGSHHTAVHWSLPIGPTCRPPKAPCRTGGRTQWFKPRETKVASLVVLQRRQDLCLPESSRGCGKRKELECALSPKHLVVCSNQGNKPFSLLFLQTSFFVVDIWSGETFL